MSEENIIYEDDYYIFYENHIYSKRCFKVLKKYKGGPGAKNTDGFIKDVNYWWSNLHTPWTKKSKWYRFRFPLTFESLTEVYETE